MSAKLQKEAEGFGALSWFMVLLMLVGLGFAAFDVFVYRVPTIELIGVERWHIWLAALGMVLVSSAYLGILSSILRPNFTQEIAALLLAGGYMAVVLLNPNFGPAQDASRDVVQFYSGTVTLLLVAYLFMQGGAVAFGPLGASYRVTVNMVISAVPFMATLVAVVLHVVDVKVMSGFMLVTTVSIAAVSLFDSIVVGSLQARMNRYANEYHQTRSTNH